MFKQVIASVAFFLAFTQVHANNDSGIVTDGIHAGCRTEAFEPGQYQKVYYISVKNGNDKGTGSASAPWKSIAHAIAESNANAQRKTAILVAEGTYAEPTIRLKEGIEILGGFSAESWKRDLEKYATIISGAGAKQIFIAANDTKIDGFIISNGTIRGNGGAIFCKGVSPVISNNIFTNNKTLKPENWKPKFMHETANDGGAIYGSDGAAPVIRQNIFVNNTTENGRGAAIAFNHQCKPVIDNNVFIHNVAGLDDPMRSSDGGAVSIFNWCRADITNNIFIGNKALASNDAGAIFLALWSSGNVVNNIVLDSESGDDAGALFVGGQEHRYDAPLDPIPSKDKFYVTIKNNQFFGNRNPSANSGVMRFTMESRGEFTNNLTAYNTGVYFQRSEVTVKQNVILDNFLFIETKEGLKQGSIEDNIIWGKFSLETPAKVAGNVMKEGAEEAKGNKAGTPAFKNDGLVLQGVSATFSKSQYYTDILLSSSFSKDELRNRIVKSGDKWGVIRSNNNNEISVWGDFRNVSELQVLPTFTLLKPLK